MRAFEKPMAADGDNSALTPAAIARVDSPRHKLTQASCTATSDDEQAVSTAKLGPCRSKTYDIRLVALHRGVIGKRDPDKDSGLRPRECFRDDPRTLQRFPGQLQEKALLRV